MELGALCLTLVAIVLWAGISTRVAVISTPIFFVAVGLVLTEGLHLFNVETDSHQVKIIAEITLVWVLFAGTQCEDAVITAAIFSSRSSRSKKQSGNDCRRGS